MNSSRVADSQDSTGNSSLLQYTRYLSQKLKKVKPQSKYDPFKSPPDFLMASYHGVARRVCQLGESELRRQGYNVDSDSDLESPDPRHFGREERPKLSDNSGESLQPLTSENRMNSQRDQSCPCCGFQVQNRQFRLCVDPRKLSHLGVTYPLYFQFIKKCFILLVIQLCMSGSYNIILNSMGTTCINQKHNNFICNTSAMNSMNQEQQSTLYVMSHNHCQIQSVGNCMTVVVLIVLIEMFKVNQEINRYHMEKQQVTPADYTVEIKGYHEEPLLDQVDKLIHDLLRAKIEDRVEICKIYFLFDMKPYSLLFSQKIQLHRERNVYRAKIRQGISSNDAIQIKQKLDLTEQELAKVDSRLQAIEHSLQQCTYCKISMSSQPEELVLVRQDILGRQESQILPYQGPQLIFSGKMLVTLNSRTHTKVICDEWKLSTTETFWYWMHKYGLSSKEKTKEKLKRFIYQGRLLSIKRAAEPSDIIWANIGSKSSNRRKRMLINFSIISIFIITSAVLVGIKRFLKRRSSFYESQLWSIGLSFLASTVVALTNTTIGIVLRKFAGLETHQCQTDYFVSVGRSLAYLYFINMVFTTLGSNMLSIGNFQTSRGFPFSLEGLLYDFFFLFITNSYLSSIFNYFDIVWGYRLLQRRKQLKLGANSHLSQQEANQLFEGHPADMALRYANVLKLMFFTATVSPLLPLGIIMSMVGLIILYWVDKYLLLRRYVCPHYLDSQLADAMMDALSLFTVFLGFGNILVMFFPLLNDKIIIEFVWPDFYSNAYFYIALLGFSLSLCYRYIFKLRVIRQLYFKVFSIKIPKKRVHQTYMESKSTFRSDYENYHPVLREYYLPGLSENDKDEKIIAPDLLQDIRQRLHD